MSLTHTSDGRTIRTCTRCRFPTTRKSCPASGFISLSFPNGVLFDEGSGDGLCRLFYTLCLVLFLLSLSFYQPRVCLLGYGRLCILFYFFWPGFACFTGPVCWLAGSLCSLAERMDGWPWFMEVAYVRCVCMDMEWNVWNVLRFSSVRLYLLAGMSKGWNVCISTWRRRGWMIAQRRR